MKILLIALTLAAFALLILYPKLSYTNFHSYLYYSPCNTPITYKIGTVDPKFNLSPEQFGSFTKIATQIWNESYGKTLFKLDPKATLSVNLIYDERQSLNNRINQLEGNLKQNESNFSSELAQYDQAAASFKKRVADLNNQIDSWNQRGGAPKEEYDQLIKEQQALNQEAGRLNTQAKNLNRSADSYNAEVGKLNQTVETYNEALQFRPEEGIYDPKVNKIEIYFNINQKELTHTLAHELGHALGLNHNSNPKSIMYSLATSATKLSSDDLAALNKICQEKTVFEVLVDRAKVYYQYYVQKFSLN